MKKIRLINKKCILGSAFIILIIVMVIFTISINAENTGGTAEQREDEKTIVRMAASLSMGSDSNNKVNIATLGDNLNNYIGSGNTTVAQTSSDVITVTFIATGNVYEVNKEFGPIFEEDKLSIPDETPPEIISVTGNSEEWVNRDITLTVNAIDEGVGLHEIAYSFDNGTTWQESNQKTYTSNTSGIIIKVRDAVGNIAEHTSIDITKIDKTAPTINDVTPSVSGVNITITVNATDSESGIGTYYYSIDNGATYTESTSSQCVFR